MHTGIWDILQAILNDNKCVDIFRPDALPKSLCGLWIKKDRNILKPWLRRSWRRFPQSYSSTCRKQLFLSDHIKYFKTNNNNMKWYPFVLPLQALEGEGFAGRCVSCLSWQDGGGQLELFTSFLPVAPCTHPESSALPGKSHSGTQTSDIFRKQI